MTKINSTTKINKLNKPPVKKKVTLAVIKKKIILDFKELRKNKQISNFQKKQQVLYLKKRWLKAKRRYSKRVQEYYVRATRQDPKYFSKSFAPFVSMIQNQGLYSNNNLSSINFVKITPSHKYINLFRRKRFKTYAPAFTGSVPANKSWKTRWSFLTFKKGYYKFVKTIKYLSDKKLDNLFLLPRYLKTRIRYYNPKHSKFRAVISLKKHKPRTAINLDVYSTRRKGAPEKNIMHYWTSFLIFIKKLKNQSDKHSLCQYTFTKKRIKYFELLTQYIRILILRSQRVNTVNKLHLPHQPYNRWKSHFSEAFAFLKYYFIKTKHPLTLSEFKLHPKSFKKAKDPFFSYKFLFNKSELRRHHLITRWRFRVISKTFYYPISKSVVLFNKLILSKSGIWNRYVTQEKHFLKAVKQLNWRNKKRKAGFSTKKMLFLRKKYTELTALSPTPFKRPKKSFVRFSIYNQRQTHYLPFYTDLAFNRGVPSFKYTGLSWVKIGRKMTARRQYKSYFYFAQPYIYSSPLLWLSSFKNINKLRYRDNKTVKFSKKYFKFLKEEAKRSLKGKVTKEEFREAKNSLKKYVLSVRKVRSNYFIIISDTSGRTIFYKSAGMLPGGRKRKLRKSIDTFKELVFSVAQECVARNILGFESFYFMVRARNNLRPYIWNFISRTFYKQGVVTGRVICIVSKPHGHIARLPKIRRK